MGIASAIGADPQSRSSSSAKGKCTANIISGFPSQVPEVLQWLTRAHNLTLIAKQARRPDMCRRRSGLRLWRAQEAPAVSKAETSGALAPSGGDYPRKRRRRMPPTRYAVADWVS